MEDREMVDYERDYYLKNKEKWITVYNNTKNAKERRRKYNLTESSRKSKEKYRERNREKTRLKSEAWRKRNPDYFKEYYQENKERVSRVNKEYLSRNIEKTRNDRLLYIKTKDKNDKEFHIKRLLRVRLRNALEYYTKNGKVMPSHKYGVDYKAIMEYLKPFPEDFLTVNGKYQIHHKEPLNKFNFVNSDGTVNTEEIRKAFRPENHKIVTREEHQEIHRIRTNNHNQTKFKMESIKMKIWITKTDLECLNEGEEVTIGNEVDIEADLCLDTGRIARTKCDRCKQETDDIVETEKGYFLCYGCDAERLSRVNNPENEKTEKEFDKEVRIIKINTALEGLSQQEAYDLICYYKERMEDIYPMIIKTKSED